MRWVLTGMFLLCTVLHGEELWNVSPRITAMGGIRFASLDEDHTVNTWDISRIKAGRVFDDNPDSRVTLETFGSMGHAVTQDSFYSVHNGDSSLLIHSFAVNERELGAADIFLHPKEQFYFGAFAQVQDDYLQDTVHEEPYQDGWLEDSERMIVVEGYTGWKRDNASLCVSVGSASRKSINRTTQSYKIEGSFALRIKESMHIGVLQGYINGKRNYIYEPYGPDDFRESEYTDNTAFFKNFFDWKATKNGKFALSVGIHREISYDEPYDPSPFMHFDIDEMLYCYSDLFQFGEFEIPLAITNFREFWSWYYTRYDDFDLTDFSLESGVRWRGKIICFQFDREGDIRFGAEYPILGYKLRAGYMYEGSMADWKELSPHIVSGGVGISIGDHCKIDLVGKYMYEIFVGGGEVSMDL